MLLEYYDCASAARDGVVVFTFPFSHVMQIVLGWQHLSIDILRGHTNFKDITNIYGRITDSDEFVPHRKFVTRCFEVEYGDVGRTSYKSKEY